MNLQKEKSDDSISMVLIVVAGFCLAYGTAMVGIVYVAWHFIRKFW